MLQKVSKGPLSIDFTHEEPPSASWSDFLTPDLSRAKLPLFFLSFSKGQGPLFFLLVVFFLLMGLGIGLPSPFFWVLSSTLTVFCDLFFRLWLFVVYRRVSLHRLILLTYCFVYSLLLVSCSPSSWLFVFRCCLSTHLSAVSLFTHLSAQSSEFFLFV